MEVFLDGWKLQEAEEAHIYLKEELEFPEYYGENLDALYDCLTDICEETTVYIDYPEDAGESDFYERLKGVFEDAMEYNDLLQVEYVDRGGEGSDAWDEDDIFGYNEDEDY